MEEIQERNHSENISKTDVLQNELSKLTISMKNDLQNFLTVENEIQNINVLDQNKINSNYNLNTQISEVVKLKDSVLESAKHHSVNKKLEKQLSKEIELLESKLQGLLEENESLRNQKQSINKQYTATLAALNMVINHYSTNFAMDIELENEDGTDNSRVTIRFKDPQFKPVNFLMDKVTGAITTCDESKDLSKHLPAHVNLLTAELLCVLTSTL